MNPFRPLLDSIEKLISEHGSASILRDHVNLLREQFTVLEKQNFSLQDENSTLKKKIENLDEVINQLRQENKELNDVLHARPIVVETDFDPRKS